VGAVQPANPGQGSSRQPRLLNYLTYPNVLIWSAAVASCAIPGVFNPVELFAKDPNGVLVRVGRMMPTIGTLDRRFASTRIAGSR
jgi:hypothetical protein